MTIAPWYPRTLLNDVGRALVLADVVDGGDVHEPEKTIVVELADERLKKLIVEVADPSATVRLLTDAIKQTRA